MNFSSQTDVLSALCQQLKQLLADADDAELARKRMRLLAEHDVFRWFVPREYGGFDWSSSEILRGYIEISSACLSTAFVLTQRSGAVSRIRHCANDSLKENLLGQLAEGSVFGTVGISHLTTSHRHLSAPVLRARQVDDGFLLDGFSPWVTGISIADFVIVGASCDGLESSSERPVAAADAEKNGAGTIGRWENQILAMVPTTAKGVARPGHADLIALTDSCTGPCNFDEAFVPDSQLVGGPVPNIMSSGSGGNTGGLQTSALALGLTQAAIGFMTEQASRREEISSPLKQLTAQFEECLGNLLAAAEGGAKCTNEEIRATANSLVIRATQAALMVAKGAGFRRNHPVGRWCQQALFFLVWSCPQPVTANHLCELAQITD